MKKLKSIFSLALCLLLFAQLLAGCTSRKAETSSSMTGQAATEQGTTGKTALETVKSESLYPISNGDVTLKIWMPIHKTATPFIQTYAENEAFIRAMEDTGVKLEFMHPAIGQEKEQFNLMVASGDMTDITCRQEYPGGDVQGVTDGIFEDLTDLLPENAPDYYGLITGDNDFRKVATVNGRVYTFFPYKYTDASKEGEWHRLQLRADWIKEFQMDVPKTFEQLEAYFQKVLETKPGVAPFVLASDGYEMELMMAYGLYGDFFQIDGEIQYAKMGEGFRQYLEMLNKWYKAGYISKDFTTVDELKLFPAGKAASYCGNSITAFETAREIGYEVTTAPYLRLYEGQKLHGGYILFPKNATWGANISAKSKYKAEAAKFTNYGYTEEGRKTFAYGPKGISWVEDPDGIPKYTDYMLKNPKYTINDVNYIIRMHTYWAYFRDYDSYSMPVNQVDTEALKYRLMWADDPDVDTAYRLPPFTLNPKDTEERSTIMNTVNTYKNEMVLKFITGIEPLSNYDKYTETLKSMNIERAIEITQKAFDEYKNQ